MARTSRKVQPKEKRIYVLDTCVLLHDPQAIYKFAEHDIYIPLAVIDDLDEQKTRRESVGWSAREVFRILDNDAYTLDDLTSKGVEVNPDGGRLFIYNTEAPLQKNQLPNIVRVNSDNAIINACKSLAVEFPQREIIMVTKDTGLRVRASSWGCKAENYRSDLVSNDDYTGVKRVEVTNNDDWTVLNNQLEIKLNKLSTDLNNAIGVISPNEFVIFEYGNLKCPAWFRKDVLINLDKKHGDKNKDQHSKKSAKPQFSGVYSKNLEQTLALEILADDEIPMVVLHGKAGTGKTLLAIAVALHKIQTEGTYKQIIVIKPLIPVGGHDIGALPGDKFEKISAWLGPIRDNIEQLVGYTRNPHDTFESMVEDGRIEVEAMAFIQGRSIPNSIIIVDEAENLTPRECRMVVERCGKDSKIILLGDLSQVENPYLDSRSNGLAHAIQGCKGQEMCGVVHLLKVERSPLAALASKIFNKPEASR